MIYGGNLSEVAAKMAPHSKLEGWEPRRREAKQKEPFNIKCIKLKQKTMDTSVKIQNVHRKNVQLKAMKMEVSLVIKILIT